MCSQMHPDGALKISAPSVHSKDDLRWHIIDGIVVFDNRILFSDLYSAEAEGTPTPTQVEGRKINSLKL